MARALNYLHTFLSEISGFEVQVSLIQGKLEEGRGGYPTIIVLHNDIDVRKVRAHKADLQGKQGPFGHVSCSVSPLCRV